MALIYREVFLQDSASRLHILFGGKTDNPNWTDDYGVQIHCFATKLYRLSRAVPLSTDYPLLRFFLWQFWGSHQKNIFAETPQLKLCNWSEAVRTPILQFWRLLFCQLNYWPITAIRRLALVFIVPCVTLSNSDLQRLIGVHPLVVFNVVAPQNHPERLKFL